ncbi:hypothetical protein [Paenibacillus sinopodophylli]|uniref:hypothetical protein n=1 Tax=Paenibacillus sinopodophylli TaxID=1837342 RepID=UPI00110CAA8D|nr:hypothetical protein [Paenibacillus sinopodophylli]
MLQVFIRRMSIRRLHREIMLAEPIYRILHNEKVEWYKQQWERFSLLEGRVTEDEIEEVVPYISERIEELSKHLSGLALSKRDMKKITFFVEYVDTLKQFTRHDFNSRNIMMYMSLYNEVLLGSTRYSNLVKALASFEDTPSLE